MLAITSFFSRFLGELHRRKVLRVAASYAIVAWLLLQVAEVTFEPLHVPDWVMTMVVLLAIIGFPRALVLAWAFDLTPDGIEKDGEDAAADTEAVSAPHPSIAVLSFDDMSPEQDQEYFCDGIAEEILNRLVRIDKLGVAARTSSFRIKGQNVDIGAIARELNVSTILEGSVRKTGNRLRVTTQLINASDGYHLWSASYDRELEDIFEIQEEIAASVAAALELTLVASSSQDYGTDNVEAYEYYLKGLYFFHRWGPTNVRYGVEMFAKAVAADPGYALAWAALADSYAMLCMYWDASRANLDGADRASRKALSLAPDLADTHVSRGLSFTVRREHEAAAAEFDTALKLNPDLFEASYFYGRICFQQGKLERAAALFEQAERARPEDFQAPILLRQVYSSLGRDKDALAAAQRGVIRAEKHLQLNPDDTRALNLGLGGFVTLGNKERAIEWAERSLDIDGNNPDTLYNVACGLAQIGEPERAMDNLELAGLRGVMIAEWAENDSDLASLHELPRFRAIIDKIRAHELERRKDSADHPDRDD
ncbi:MAG: tetratricopeptide repeat protein [Chromatiales bacterium]